MTTESRNILNAMSAEQLFWIAISNGPETRRRVSKVLTARAIAAKRRPGRLSADQQGGARLRRAA